MSITQSHTPSVRRDDHSDLIERSPATIHHREQALERLLREVRARRAEFALKQRLSDDIVALLRETGIFRSLVARRFGGDENKPSAFFQLIECISRADGSTGWVASFGHGAIYLSALPVTTLEAIYAAGPDVIFAGGLFPPQPARRVDDGFEVSGRWSWGSGCTSASLIGVGIRVEDDGAARGGLPRLAVMPRDHVRIVENWNVNGLKGTGSHDMVVEKVLVREDWTFVRRAGSGLDTPLFRYPAIALAAQALAVVGLGVARSALDEVRATAGTRSITGAPPLSDRAHVQIELAKAEARLRSARAFLYETADEAYERLEAGGDLDSTTRTLLRLGATHAAHVGAEVARAAYAVCGTAGIFVNHPLAWALQDALVVPQHAFVAEGTWQNAGQSLLGLDAGVGFL